MGKYIVWQPEAGQTEADGARVSARDPKTAAEEWADHDDYASNEFHIVNGQPATVMVRDLDSGKSHEWIVQGEQRREYTARLRVPLVTSAADLRQQAASDTSCVGAFARSHCGICDVEQQRERRCTMPNRNEAMKVCREKSNAH